MCCTCIAFKIFNDSPVNNRFFAYLTNVDIKDFNKLEMEIMKRLDFNALIEKEVYSNYEEQLAGFANFQAESLQQSLDQYKLDKKVLRKLKQSIVQECNSANLKPQEHFAKELNYADTGMRKMMEKRHIDETCVFPVSVSKFRFDSCNSYKFQKHFKKRRSRRSLSNPRLQM